MKSGKGGLKPLPTLTHVVLPAPVAPASPVSPKPLQHNNTLASADLVLQRLLPLIEERMRAVLEQVLLEQKTAILTRLRLEVETILGDIHAKDAPSSNATDVVVSHTKQLFDPSQR